MVRVICRRLGVRTGVFGCKSLLLLPASRLGARKGATRLGVLGIFGVLIAYTGYLRAAQFEKGWDFYSHEPVFWFKMTLLAIYGASTFFNTTTIIKRAVVKQQSGSVPPVTEALATRMKKICNAGLVALALIPLSATFMARGVGYNQDIPWEIEAGVVALVFAGLGFKYVKEALDFEDA